MLRRLSIRDLAIIDQLEVELSEGFTVLSGETGAGKSIIIDALELLSGSRADATLVRPGSDRTEVSAEFDLSAMPQLRDWLADEELNEDDGSCLLRRTVRAEGGSRAWINGRPASAQQLRSLTEGLLEIHGQHEHQALLDREHQLQLLDAYGQLDLTVTPVREAAAQLAELRSERRQQASRDSEALRLELADLQTQIDALEQLQPTPERIEALDQEQRRLSHRESLLGGLADVGQWLDGDETGTVRRQLLRAEQELRRLAELDATLAPLAAALEEARIAVEEVARDTGARLEDDELDPARLAEVEQALSALHALARRHRVLLSDLPGLLQSLQTQVQTLTGRLDRLTRLDELEATAVRRWRTAATALSQARQQAAAGLSKAVETLLDELGMAGGRFQVQFDARAEDGSATGAEQVEFLVSSNAGMPPRPLRKVASGGELARLSLAIKVATASVEGVPVLVFDEVDSGIGGPTAEIVGRLLRTLGKRRQVLSVTHLPQVAACAHQHLRASKQVRDGQTVATLDALDSHGRRSEVARMLGGVEQTDQSLAHADEMLQRGQRVR